MNASKPLPDPASAAQIRAALGNVDDAVVAAVQEVGATAAEVGEAAAWMASDDYLHRKLQHAAQGRVARVIDVLEECLEPPPRE